MKTPEAPKRQVPIGRSKSERNQYRHLFLFLSVFESWIARMLDGGSSGECVGCGIKREDGCGFLLGAPFVRLGLKVLETMCSEAAIAGEPTSYSHLKVSRYQELAASVNDDGENVWCCAECFAYTMETMGALVARTRAVSCHCGFAWITAQLKQVTPGWTKAPVREKRSPRVDVGA